MFGRLASVRIRVAEDALAVGRLDDACDVALASELSCIAKVQELRARLAQALLDRGQDHLFARRFAQALADFDKAARCGHLTAKVDDWRRRAREALEEQQAEEAQEAAALAEARRRMEAGSLVGAGQALEDAATDHPQRAALAEEIDSRTRKATAALDAARAAMNRNDLKSAGAYLKAAKQLHSRLEGMDVITTELVDRVLSLATESFNAGRIALAGRQLEDLGDLAESRPVIHDLVEAVKLANEAAAALKRSEYSRASVLVRRLSRVATTAEWVAEVRRHFDELEEHLRVVLEGPLGVIMGFPSPPADRSTAPEETMAAAKPARQQVVAPPPLPGNLPRANAHAAPGLPRRLLLRIDGVGSFMLLRGDRIGIGRGGPGSTADLPLLADLSERQAEIVRSGEDYFVVSPSGVELAGAPVDHALLRNGDRIRLGKRVKLTFQRPSLKSTTALLDLGDGVRSVTDCRRVILWSGPLLLGGTRECHVHLGSQSGDFVLTERGGRIYVKAMGPGGDAAPVALGEQMTVGPLRFRTIDLSDASGPGRVTG
jgi:tetratricopeptide (TPR) repeat protein